MATIQIKNVPEDAHAVLRRRAAAAGQSLQDYMLGRILKETSKPTLDEVLERIGHRSGGRLSMADAATYVREDRDSR
jgi:plasmid stability protein